MCLSVMCVLRFACVSVVPINNLNLSSRRAILNMHCVCAFGAQARADTRESGGHLRRLGLRAAA